MDPKFAWRVVGHPSIKNIKKLNIPILISNYPIKKKPKMYTSHNILILFIFWIMPQHLHYYCIIIGKSNSLAAFEGDNGPSLESGAQLRIQIFYTIFCVYDKS